MSIQDQEKLIRDLLRENPEATVKDFAPFLREVEQSILRVKMATVLRGFPTLAEQHQNLGF